MPCRGVSFAWFIQTCYISSSFQDALAVKIWMDLFKGLWSYGVLSWGSQISLEFSAPLSGETVCWTPKCFWGVRKCLSSCIILSSLVGLRLCPPLGQPKTLSFCLLVCMTEFVRTGTILPWSRWKTHTQPLYGTLDFVWVNPGEPVTEETFTHSHLSWSSIIPYLLSPSITIHGILPVQFMQLTVFFHNICPSFIWSTSWHGRLAPSTSYSIHFFTQSLET